MTDLTPDEVLARMQAMDSQATPSHTDIVENAEPKDFVSSLPEPKPGEFFLSVFGPTTSVFCMREITWHEANDIEVDCYMKGLDERPYFNGERQRREVLRRAISWVAEMDTAKVAFNLDGHILKRIHEDVVESLWELYAPYTYIDSDEAARLLQAATLYFSGQGQGHPIPSDVLRVDMMIRLCRPSLNEINQMTMRDFERLKVILIGRARALGIETTRAAPAIDNKNPLDDLPSNFFPPGVKPSR